MPMRDFTYRGKSVKIDEQEEKATITIDNQYQFSCALHKGNINLWACPSVYGMAPEPKCVAKKLIDNLDLLTSPTTAPIEGMKILKK